MNKNTVNKAATVIVAGCGAYMALSMIVMLVLIIGGAFLLKSCTQNHNRKIEESEKLLARFTESDLPDTLELTNGVTIEKLFATQYRPLDAEYGTIVLQNYKYTPAMFGPFRNVIAVEADGTVITEDYFFEITYDYYSYLPMNEKKFLACSSYNEITFIAPDGRVICTKTEEELAEYSETPEEDNKILGITTAVTGETVHQRGELYYVQTDAENSYSIYTVYTANKN